MFDLDGTLADISLLLVMHPGDPRDFESRADSHRLVPAHDWVVELAAQQRRAQITVIVLTSRRERWRERSREWLVMHGVAFDDLIMRADTDNRSELEFKRTALAAIQQQYKVVLAVDDNPTVIALWSSHGVSTRLWPGGETGLCCELSWRLSNALRAGAAHDSGLWLVSFNAR